MAAPAAAGRASGSGSRVSTLVDLPSSALLLVFDHLSSLTAPGVCLASRVCGRWREVAATAKGLRVVFVEGSTSSALSMADWISRHAPGVEALTISGSRGRWVLSALEGAAAQAMRQGQPLGLTTLILGDPWPANGGGLLALPNLRYLNMGPRLRLGLHRRPREVAAAVRASLAPLQQATALTELILEGPIFDDPIPTGWSMDEMEDAHQEGIDAVMQQTQALLPRSLRALTWHPRLIYTGDPGVAPIPRAAMVSLEHLTNLEVLRLFSCRGGGLPVASLAALPSLRRLELVESEDSLAALQPVVSKLAIWGPDSMQHFEPQLEQPPGLTLLLVPLRASYDRPLPAIGTWRGLRGLVLDPYGDQEADSDEEGDGEDAGLDLAVLSNLQRLVRLELMEEPWTLSPLQLTALQRLTRLKLDFNWQPDHRADMADLATLDAWRLSLGYLTRLVVLEINMSMVACRQAWLTHLPDLAVLQLDGCSAHELPQVVDHLAAVEHRGAGQERLLLLHTSTLPDEDEDEFRAALASSAPSWQLLVGTAWSSLLWLHGNVCFPRHALPLVVQAAVDE